MARKTPTAQGGRGVERLAGNSAPLISLACYRVQALASRYMLTLEAVAIIAGAYLMGAR